MLTYLGYQQGLEKNVSFLFVFHLLETMLLSTWGRTLFPLKEDLIKIQSMT